MLQTSITRDESRTRLSSVSLPLAVSFVATIWAMVIVCRFELASTQSWRELLIFPLVCLSITACMHGFVVFIVRNLMDRQESFATWSLIYGTWIPVVWVPSLVVMGNAGSVWVAVLLPLIAGLATALLLRWAAQAEWTDHVEGKMQTLFRMPADATLRQTILPALMASLSAQLGLVALLGRRDWVAGFLLALACVLLLWRFLPRGPRGLPSSVKISVASSLAALVLTAIGIVPFLKPGPGHAALERLLQMQRMKTVQASTHNSNTGYSGIILVLPPKPHQAVLPPPPDPSLNSGLAKPVVIKFDGVYWYLKEPDERPDAEARTVHGDPLKEHIHSTNLRPLLMEAHQTVLPALKLNCCSAIELNVVNADTRSGEISIEVLLRNTETKVSAAVSLGTLPVVSSMAADVAPDRPPVHETLSFRIPRSLRASQCDEITVRIKPAKERELAGSQVSVESFVLLR